MLVGILFLIIRREGLDLTSIGLRFTAVGKSIAWGMLFFVLSMAGILLCVLAMQYLDWKVIDFIPNVALKLFGVENP